MHSHDIMIIIFVSVCTSFGDLKEICDKKNTVQASSLLSLRSVKTSKKKGKER